MKQRDMLNKEIEKNLPKNLSKEIQTIKLQFDGRQFLIKIPTEFTRILQLKKGDKMKLTLQIPETEPTRKSKIQGELVD